MVVDKDPRERVPVLVVHGIPKSGVLVAQTLVRLAPKTQDQIKIA